MIVFRSVMLKNEMRDNFNEKLVIAFRCVRGNMTCVMTSTRMTLNARRHQRRGRYRRTCQDAAPPTDRRGDFLGPDSASRRRRGGGHVGPQQLPTSRQRGVTDMTRVINHAVALFGCRMHANRSVKSQEKTHTKQSLNQKTKKNKKHLGMRIMDQL